MRTEVFDGDGGLVEEAGGGEGFGRGGGEVGAVAAFGDAQAVGGEGGLGREDGVEVEGGGGGG